MSKIDLLIQKINKEFGENIINRASKFENLNLESISSGSYFLDWCINGKGFPRGKIVELYGPYSAGKGLISAFTVAEVQKLGEDCVWIDVENALDPQFMEKLGVDMKKLIVSQSTVGEPTLELIGKMLEAEPAIIVIDSIAALIPKTDLEEPLEQPLIATRARLMSRGLAKLNSLNKKTILLFLNQLRTDIGKYGNPFTTPGGRAIGHYASIRIDVRRGDFIEENKVKIGQIVKFRITKNKCGIPWKEGYFKYLYEGKIDKADEVLSLAILNKKIQPSGIWWEVMGERFQGREALEKRLNDKDFFEKFKKEYL